MTKKRSKRSNPRSAALTDWQKEWISLMLDHETGWNPTKSYGPFRSRQAAASFWNVATRLAAEGWVIVERPLGTKGAARYVIVHKDDWVITEDVEPLGLDGLGGHGLGLPPGIAKELIEEHARSLPAHTDERGRDAPLPVAARRAHNAVHPPRYEEFLRLSKDELNLLEDLLCAARGPAAGSAPSLDALAATAQRLAAEAASSAA